VGRIAGAAPTSHHRLRTALLIATPVLRVAVSIVAFALEGDRRFVVITTLVLAILLLSNVLLGSIVGSTSHTTLQHLNFSLVVVLLIFGGSVATGVLGSLIGLGGGVLIVPLLTLAFGLPIYFAIGASIISVIATSSGAAAAYVRDHLTNLRVGLFLELGTTTLRTGICAGKEKKTSLKWCQGRCQVNQYGML
jgi:uncharacterized membrane protein YfcA